MIWRVLSRFQALSFSRDARAFSRANKHAAVSRATQRTTFRSQIESK